MQRIDGLYVAHSEDMGRGVYTASDIPSGSLIEICPVIVIPASETPIIHKTVLHDYYFSWGEDRKSCAIAGGLGSLYNHSASANADFILDFPAETIEIMSVRDIVAGEQITINYHGIPSSKKKTWWEMRRMKN